MLQKIVWLQASGDRRGGGLVALGPIPSRRGEGCDARICRGWLAQAIICGAVGETAAQAIAQSIMPPDGFSGPDSLSRYVSCPPAQCHLSGIPTVVLCVLASPPHFAKSLIARVKAIQLLLTRSQPPKPPS